jgi:hypothetical protein
MPFDEKVRTKTLLWCDRHCCLCKKACGANIEVHHLVPENEGGSKDIDNAIPLCFDCHSEVMRYNEQHPRGTKYKVDELKARRDQVYEEFTRHLVPPIHYEITQQIPGRGVRTFPDVGFVISHLGDSLPVRVRVIVESVLPSGNAVLPPDFYSGQKLWNLNPRSSFSGHFEMPSELIPEDRQLELRVRVSIIDQYEREHFHLPTGFVYVPEGNYWYAEP